MKRVLASLLAVIMVMAFCPLALAADIESVASPTETFYTIDGADVILPATLTATLVGGGTQSVDAVWDTSEIAVGENTVSGTAGGHEVSADVYVYPCDEESEAVYGSTSSDSANFGRYTEFEQRKGVIVTQFSMRTTTGTNMLVVYGDSSTSYYSTGGAMIRMFNTLSGTNYVFDYYDNGWKTSRYTCKYGTTYRVRFEINTIDKVYRVYITEPDGTVYDICGNDVPFRGTNVTSVERMIITSSNLTVTDHRTSWKSGYGFLNLTRVLGAERETLEPIKVAVPDTITISEEVAPKVIIKGETMYLRENVNTLPTVTTSQEQTEASINYNAVTVESKGEFNLTTYTGGVLSPPTETDVRFSDGQTVACTISWDKTAIDTITLSAGNKVLTGTLNEIPNIEITCNVEVKEFTQQESVLTNSGGWNWYVEPSGTHIQPGDALTQKYANYATGGYEFTRDCTYMGWVNDAGDVYVSEYDNTTGAYTTFELHHRLESDDHDNPAIVILPDGRIMAWYSMHTNDPYMYYRVSKYPENITEWNDEQYYYCHTNVTNDDNTYNATYPTVLPVTINGTDSIYVGWRGVHWKPTLAQFSIPDENGVCEVLMGQTQIANTSRWSKDDGGKADSGLRPYTKYDYDYQRNRIHITYTYDHPDNTTTLNEIYYMYLSLRNDTLYTAMDEKLCVVPRNNDPSYGTYQWGVRVDDMKADYPELVVFSPNGEHRRGWTWDIKVNEAGEPCIVYVDITDTAPKADGSLPDSFPDTNEDRSHHYYYYARWDTEEEKWVTTFLTYGGKWFHENTVYERCYSGGITLDHNAADANVIFLALPTQGKYGNVFEIYRWESNDHGKTWSIQEPITQNSKVSNARPNVIYNYKQNEDGTHAGPRLLWIRGEYRYWMNFLYKTGVMTDFGGIVTQDDPEMMADATLLSAQTNEPVDVLTSSDGTYRAKFNITNISVGDGTVMLALAHYGEDDTLKNIVTKGADIPARSVPQYAVLGAPTGPGGEGSSTMGDAEIVEYIEYTPENIESGDCIKLYAFDMGINKLIPINTTPYEMTTEGSAYLVNDPITYEGEEKHIFTENEEYNGWIATPMIQNANYTPCYGANNYIAITRNIFGNTGIHMYHGTNSTTTGDANGSGGLMISHAIPETDKNFTIEFDIRFQSELSWWNNGVNSYSGFTLSHGIPAGQSDSTTQCAFQLRQREASGSPNGRRCQYSSYSGTQFGTGSWLNDINEVYGMDGTRENRTTERLMENSLFHVTLNVNQGENSIECRVFDGHRTGVIEQQLQGDASYWAENKINNITFNTGIASLSEVFVDNLVVYER
ncbi:MAG: BNR-4 repeat-containing protein [Clostridia bacterium]|nr:BNR-4 repeat-containing protein [Clostridia bacterium]